MQNLQQSWREMVPLSGWANERQYNILINTQKLNWLHFSRGWWIQCSWRINIFFSLPCSLDVASLQRLFAHAVGFQHCFSYRVHRFWHGSNGAAPYLYGSPVKSGALRAPLAAGMLVCEIALQALSMSSAAAIYRPLRIILYANWLHWAICSKEIDQTVSLTSHSARKSFIELWTFNYLFTQIVSLCPTNSKWCQTMLWHNFHDKLTVHEVLAFSGIICKLTSADYCLTKAHKWISGRCTSLQHLQWCSYDLISADCC